jgi:hypothetical protein
MAINLRSDLAKFTALPYPSIKTVYTQPPYTLSTAQMPLAFFRNVEVERTAVPSFTYKPGIVNCTAEFVVLIDASRQNLQDKNYDLTRKIIEEIVVLWETNGAELGLNGFTIRESSEDVNETSYYSVLAEVNFAL